MERKEAIEVIKKNWPDSSFTMLREALETLVPELAESEDERIRKSIIELLNEVHFTFKYYDINKMLAWLEKQGQDGKVWFYRDDYVRDKKQAYQDGIDNVLNNPQKYGLEKQGKNSMGISEATKQKLEDKLHEALEKETPESCNEFLDEQDEQKPAWSEEDKENLDRIITIIHCYTGTVEEEIKLTNWLKSLKDRIQPKTTWKPSEEQMDALESAVSSLQSTALESLYNKLKKL